MLIALTFFEIYKHLLNYKRLEITILVDGVSLDDVELWFDKRLEITIFVSGLVLGNYIVKVLYRIVKMLLIKIERLYLKHFFIPIVYFSFYQ